MSRPPRSKRRRLQRKRETSFSDDDSTSGRSESSWSSRHTAKARCAPCTCTSDSSTESDDDSNDNRLTYGQAIDMIRKNCETLKQMIFMYLDKQEKEANKNGTQQPAITEKDSPPTSGTSANNSETNSSRKDSVEPESSSRKRSQAQRNMTINSSTEPGPPSKKSTPVPGPSSKKTSPVSSTVPPLSTKGSQKKKISPKNTSSSSGSSSKRSSTSPRQCMNLKCGVLLQPQSPTQYVAFGPGRTLITMSQFEEIDWSASYSIATRKLLTAVFGKIMLATHSLTGKASPASEGSQGKQLLDPRKVMDIVTTVCDMCFVTEKEVRTVITLKCSEESKQLKKSKKKNN